MDLAHSQNNMRIKSPEAVWTSPILPISSTVFYQVDPPLVKASYFLFRQTAVLWPSDFVKLALLCKNDPWLDGHVKINPHGNVKSFIEHGTETMCGSFTIHKAPLEQLTRALFKTHTQVTGQYHQCITHFVIQYKQCSCCWARSTLTQHLYVSRRVQLWNQWPKWAEMKIIY